MNCLLRAATVVLTACFVLSSACAAENAEPTAEVLRVDSRRSAALLKSDIEVLREIFSDDLVYVHASGRVQSKSEYLSLLAHGDLRYLTMRYDGGPRVRVLGRDAAVVT